MASFKGPIASALLVLEGAIVRHRPAVARCFRVPAVGPPQPLEILPPRVVHAKMDGQELDVMSARLTLRVRAVMSP